jgi:hypothetical protein
MKIIYNKNIFLDMQSFKKVLNEGGIGRKYNFSANVTSKDGFNFNMNFQLKESNAQEAAEKAKSLLESAEYLETIHSISEPKEII